MRTFTRDDGIQILEVTAAEHAALASLGKDECEWLASTAGTTLGLGSLVPTSTDVDGAPMAGTTWWTGHPASADNAESEFVKLGSAVADVATASKAGAMKLIVDDIKASRAVDATTGLDLASIKARFGTARGQGQTK